MVWAWLERGKRRGRSGEAGEASVGRARPALLGARVLLQHVLRGAHLLVPGRPGEARDRVFGVAGESLRTGGHVLGAGSPKNRGFAVGPKSFVFGPFVAATHH